MNALNQNDKFTKDKIEYKVLNIYKTSYANVAILQRETYCPYVVVLDIKNTKTAAYAWSFGHYFDNLENAYKLMNDIL